MRALRWGGHFGCLEATYEESKPVEGPQDLPEVKGLEATYEESKRLPRLEEAGDDLSLEATYEESKQLFPLDVADAYAEFGSYL